MELWERGQHAGLVGDAEAEGATREGRAAFGGKEEDDTMARGFHETVLLGKLRHAVRRATDWEGGEGTSFRMTNAQKPGDQLQRYSGRSTQICGFPLWKTPHAQPLRSMRTCPKRYPST